MLEQSIHEVINDSVDRVWRRIVMYCGGYGLAAYYYDFTVAVICFAISLAAEIVDCTICVRLRRIDGNDQATLIKKRNWIIFSSLLCSSSIVLASYLIASSNPIGFQLLPLFFIFAAALYAVMNNHQIFAAMTVRLAIYGLAALIVAVRQLVIDAPSVESHLWVQFAMVFFIYYLIVDCAINYRRAYVERMRQIEELDVARNLAETATNNKDEMVSALAHDLRTPLNAMLVSAQILETSGLNEKQNEYAQTVVASGWYMNRLLSDILDAEQLSSGQMSISYVDANLRDIIQELLTLHCREAQAKGLAFSHSIASDFPEALMIDPVRIRQVLNNLLSNAVKFTVQGSISVDAQFDGDFVSIQVKDTGPGIARENIERSFGRFSQIQDSGGINQIRGSGLGLWISRRLMRLMEGELTAESVVGEGSIFTMRFYAQPVDLPLQQTG